jgi:hypothetical protein
MTTDPVVAALGRLTELPGVFEAAEAARGSVDALLRDLRSAGLRTRVPEVTTAALRRSAWASARLDPEPWQGDLDGYGPPFADDPGGRTGAAALRVTTELSSLASVWGRAPMQALARLHTLAAGGDGGARDDLGRPRTDPQVAARLQGLAPLAGSTGAPAVVVAAVVHGELLAVQPFSTRNALVARAASRLVLLERGLDPSAASVPEEGHVELGPEAYARALDGYRDGTPEGVAAWLVHCATAVAVGGRVGREVAALVASTS